MTVEEAYKILKDSKMSNKECNFKVKNNNPGGVKPPKYFVDFQKQMLDFQKQMLDFQKQMLEFVKRQEQFNQYVLDVFKRNNLK